MKSDAIDTNARDNTFNAILSAVFDRSLCLCGFEI